MTATESLGTYLKRLRSEAGGLSQKAAAAKIGPPVTRSDWNRWEKAKRGIGPVNAERIATAFQRPLDELLAFVTPRGSAGEVLETLTRLEARIARIEAEVGIPPEANDVPARAAADERA